MRSGRGALGAGSPVICDPDERNVGGADSFTGTATAFIASERWAWRSSAAMAASTIAPPMNAQIVATAIVTMGVGSPCDDPVPTMLWLVLGGEGVSLGVRYCGSGCLLSV